jgi:hypothetical protein
MRATAKTSTPSKYEAAIGVVLRLRDREAELRDEELARLERGEKIEAEEVAAVDANERAADALLAGKSIADAAKRTIRTIVQERAVLALAMQKAESNVEAERRALAATRFAESQDELRDMGRKLVLAALAMDRVQRERDALIRRIGLSSVLPHEGWLLGGKLSNTGSQVYRLAECGVQQGWISQKELAEAYAESRKGW